jgi:hypothetical protein
MGPAERGRNANYFQYRNIPRQSAEMARKTGPLNASFGPRNATFPLGWIAGLLFPPTSLAAARL